MMIFLKLKLHIGRIHGRTPKERQQPVHLDAIKTVVDSLQVCLDLFGPVQIVQRSLMCMLKINSLGSRSLTLGVVKRLSKQTCLRFPVSPMAI